MKLSSSVSVFSQRTQFVGAICAGAVVLIAFSAQAQTYIYTYTGSEFTSVFNAANELLYGIVPYTTSGRITGSITFSALLGDNYEGNPSATMLSYNFTDGVGPQNVAGSTFGGGLGFPFVMDSTFGTDSSGNIVSWNFEVVAFLPPSQKPRESRLKMNPATLSIRATSISLRGS